MPSQRQHEPAPDVVDAAVVEQDESSIYATDAVSFLVVQIHHAALAED